MKHMSKLLGLIIVVSLLTCLAGFVTPVSAGNVQAATVVTLEPTDVFGTSATLNGQMTSLGSDSSLRVWFAIGKVGEIMSDDTPMQMMTAPGLFSFTKTDLEPGTQYWVFAIAYNGLTCVRGESIIFTTAGTTDPLATPPSPSASDETQPLHPGKSKKK